MYKYWILAVLLFVGLSIAAPAKRSHAQAPPIAFGSVVTKTTIALTNTYISIAAKNGNRKGCLLQNVGTHTMFVYLDNTGGNTPPPDTTTSFQLAAGQTLNCNVGGGGVVSDEIWLTGTVNDIAILALQ